MAEAGGGAVAGVAVAARGGLRGGLAHTVLARALVRAVVVKVRQPQLRVRQPCPPAQRAARGQAACPLDANLDWYPLNQFVIIILFMMMNKTFSDE